MTQPKSKTPFVSLRWRVTLPLLLIMLLSGLIAYLLVVGTITTIDTPTKQAYAIGTAIISALMTTAVYLFTAGMSGRVNQITRTVDSLRAGHRTARTGMQPTDEIGKLGYKVDQYVEYTQDKQDELRSALRRKRREVAHLLSVLEALPDGVIVQDLDGRVLLMNDHARQLLGSARVFRTAGLYELTALVTDQLGAMLMPGLYTLGDPQRVELDGKLLSAQAAAVTGQSQHRLGTVILLRDLSDHVRQERKRDVKLKRLEREVQQPLAELARQAMYTPIGDFSRELQRHAVALQKMIVELRDLGDVDEDTVKRTQRPLSLETLIWALVNEWRQIAQANNLQLQVEIGRKGLFVLGDERRLRWAVGNLIDNAIKYTPPGGIVSLEIRPEENEFAQLRIRDNGVGILAEEQGNLFVRFWRGTPIMSDGRVIRVPGMGQGLHTARQIIQAHGGALQVRSKPGVGTAVYFTLPLTAPEGLQLSLLHEGETMLLEVQHSDELKG